MIELFMQKVDTDNHKVDELLSSRYLEAIFPSLEKVQEIFKSGKKLTFYLGIDPTGPDIHLGHTTNLLFLKKIALLGHEVILLIGDFTAQIGDPTGKDIARKPLSKEEVKRNMSSYIDQVKKILKPKLFKVKHNSKWLAKMDMVNVVKLASRFTVQQMIARDMFQKRIKEEKPIGLHEFLYPLLQGYDSVAMGVDGEVGGNDQTFNMLAGRDLVKKILAKEKIVFATKLLEDPVTGKKLMSKSEGSYISLNDQPQELFGKIMAMSDLSIIPLLSLVTEVTDEKIKEFDDRLNNNENPKNLKQELAQEIVKMYYGEGTAEKAKNEFERIFKEHEAPTEVKEVYVNLIDQQNLIDLFLAAGIENSKGEIKRLIEQKAIKVNDNLITNWNEEIDIGDDGVLVKVGPRRFYRIKRK